MSLRTVSNHHRLRRQQFALFLTYGLPSVTPLYTCSDTDAYGGRFPICLTHKLSGVGLRVRGTDADGSVGHIIRTDAFAGGTHDNRHIP